MWQIGNGKKQKIGPYHIPSAFALTVFLLLAASSISLAQKPREVPQSVSLYVTVETDGKLIKGLRPENFRLYEDGKALPFKLEEPEKPVTVAILMEYSTSSWLYSEDLAYAMNGFMQAAPEGNWYALTTFANDSKVHVDFTKQHGQLLDTFYSLGPPLWKEINTYDAIYKMLERLTGVKGRRVLIFIGLGNDTFSAHTMDDVYRKVQSTDVVIYCVAPGTLLRGSYEHRLSTTNRMRLLGAQNFLNSIAKKSGGEAWFPRFQVAYREIMTGVFQDIDFQYRMVYSPQIPADGKLHKIKVEAFRVVNDKRQNFKVRVREGWRF